LLNTDDLFCRCKKPVVAHKQFTIHKAPLVLTVHLKRFSPTGRKMPHHIKYDERISLQPVMSEGQHGPLYSLYGVICHAGSGPNSGHYYGHVKGANGQWFEMNDDSVIPTRAPIGMKSAYMLFYIREKGQALEAAVSRMQIPPRNGIAAGMKKRKVADSDDEGHEDTGVKTARPFIGPQLPSSTPDVAVSAAQRPTPNVADPQADSLKKKIAAAPKATQALQSLSLYVDEDSDKEGSVQNDNSLPANDPPPSTPPCPPTSTPATPLSIPTSNFYHSSNGKTDKGKKRKSPDGEVDENKHSYNNNWARKPLSSPHLTASSPRFQYRNQFRKSSISGGNPFNRLRGSNNLYQKDPGSHRQPIVTYKKKRRI
jgi:ubiquitin carboxyl-terminal hydrolase 36/42